MPVSDSRRVPISESIFYSWRRICEQNEMLGHLRRRQRFGSQGSGIGIEMPLRAGMIRNDLEETRFSR